MPCHAGARVNHEGLLVVLVVAQVPVGSSDCPFVITYSVRWMQMNQPLGSHFAERLLLMKVT
jgi:hypothetical protein